MKLAPLLYFASGAAMGATVMYFAIKDKLEKKKAEEVESVKKVYAEAYANGTLPQINKEEMQPKEAYETLRKNAENAKDTYAPKDDTTEEVFKDVVVDESLALHEDDIYEITQSEFGENDSFDMESYILYTDGIIADSKFEECTDEAIDLIGEDIYDKYLTDNSTGEVYIRNVNLGKDINLLLSIHTYQEDIINRGLDEEGDTED